jgi:tetratricopeptide (TPR) repeat protein
MINKENTLFGIIGLLMGLIVGFYFANSVNQGASAASTVTGGTQQTAQGNLPPGHPNVPGNNNQTGSMPETQAVIDKARQNPNDFQAQLDAADLYYQIQRFDGAIEFLKKANELQPDNYDVIVQLGNANFDADNYQVAEKWYENALAKKPGEANVRTDYGLTFMFRETPDYDRAIAEFNKVLATDPKHEQALQNLTVAYTKKGDAVRAKASLDKLTDTAPSNVTIKKLGEDITKIGAK